MEKIDFKFVSGREGGQILTGYVPTQKGVAIGNSGVTIATGVDLGQMSAAEITALSIPVTLKDKLIPYALITKGSAIRFLAKNPLAITKPEADALDEAMQAKLFMPLIRQYNRDSILPFSKIPKQAQTVLASLAWHRGPGFYKYRAFRGIWSTAIYQNWEGMADELRAYQTAVKGIKNRRMVEASLLDKIRTTAIC